MISLIFRFNALIFCGQVIIFKTYVTHFWLWQLIYDITTRNSFFAAISHNDITNGTYTVVLNLKPNFGLKKYIQVFIVFFLILYIFIEAFFILHHNINVPDPPNPLTHTPSQSKGEIIYL